MLKVPLRVTSRPRANLTYFAQGLLGAINGHQYLPIRKKLVLYTNVQMQVPIAHQLSALRLQ